MGQPSPLSSPERAFLVIEVDYHEQLRLPEDFFTTALKLIDGVLADEQAATVALHSTLNAKLAQLDSKEDRLVDLAAEGSLPIHKIQQRLTAVATERTRLKAELAQSGSQLGVGADALKIALSMIRDLPRVYRTQSTEARGAINDALFKRLYIDEDRVSAATYVPEIAEVVEAYQAGRDQAVTAADSVAVEPEPTGRATTGRTRLGRTTNVRDVLAGQPAGTPRTWTLTDALSATGETSSQFEYGGYGGEDGIRTHGTV